MVDIHPFHGVRYNQAVVRDLAQVICPPYDIIPPHVQSELYERSEHNFIQLEHARELSQDTASENKYTRAAATLSRWLARGILTVEEAPAVYLHDHHFWYQSQEYRRRGIITLVRLEEWESRVVRPHEGTLANPRSDRLSLLTNHLPREADRCTMYKANQTGRPTRWQNRLQFNGLQYLPRSRIQTLE